MSRLRSLHNLNHKCCLFILRLLDRLSVCHSLIQSEYHHKLHKLYMCAYTWLYSCRIHNYADPLRTRLIIGNDLLILNAGWAMLGPRLRFSLAWLVCKVKDQQCLVPQKAREF